MLQEALVAMFKWYQGSALMVVFLRCSLFIAAWRSHEERLEHLRLDAPRISRVQDRPLLYRGLDALSQSAGAEPQKVARSDLGDGGSHWGVSTTTDGTSFSIREKLHHTSTRKTTKVENAACSLLGIFSATGISPLYSQGGRSLGHLLAHVFTGSGVVGNQTKTHVFGIIDC